MLKKGMLKVFMVGLFLACPWFQAQVAAGHGSVAWPVSPEAFGSPAGEVEKGTIEVKVDTCGISASKGIITILRQATPEEVARRRGDWLTAHRITLWLEEDRTSFSKSVPVGTYKVKVEFNGSSTVTEPFQMYRNDVKYFDFDTGSVEVAIGPGSLRIFAHIIVLTKDGGGKWKESGIVVYHNDEPKTFLLLPGHYKLGLKLHSTMSVFEEFDIRRGDSLKFRYDVGVVNVKVSQEKGYVKGRVYFYRKRKGSTGWNQLFSNSIPKNNYTVALPAGDYKFELQCSGLRKTTELTLGWNDTRNYDFEVGTIRITFNPTDEDTVRQMIRFYQRTDNGDWKQFLGGSRRMYERRPDELHPLFPGEYKVELGTVRQVIDSTTFSIHGRDHVDIKF